MSFFKKKTYTVFLLKRLIKYVPLEKILLYFLKKGYAVVLTIDYYYIPIFDTFYNEHLKHDILITKYERKKNEITAWGFINDIYKEFQLDASFLIFYDDPKIVGMKLYKYVDGIYNFNLNDMKEKMYFYSTSKKTDLASNINAPLYLTDSLKNKEIKTISFIVLKLHKRIMLDRINYFLKNSEEDRNSLLKLKEIYKELYMKSLILQNMVLKHNLVKNYKKKLELKKKMDVLLKEIYNKEVSAYKNFLSS